jgi:hypothetical protein
MRHWRTRGWRGNASTSQDLPPEEPKGPSLSRTSSSPGWPGLHPRPLGCRVAPSPLPPCRHQQCVYVFCEVGGTPQFSPLSRTADPRRLITTTGRSKLASLPCWSLKRSYEAELRVKTWKWSVYISYSLHSWARFPQDKTQSLQGTPSRRVQCVISHR